MDASVHRALNDRAYERRKAGALEVEKLVRDSLTQRKWDKIAAVIDQLVHEFAYAVHQPAARNGGLIGLAAASIALGPEVVRYVREIVPPVLACFGDQDARVRYYACESMYNIAKTTKGEILHYFNQLFDALSKLAADSEVSVKNGSELLDRLLKDIISNSATTYVSILPPEDDAEEHKDGAAIVEGKAQNSVAFSLPRLIPLLSERILVINPFTRMFLVDWIALLDSIPDLYLVSHLPAFLKGLFRFLNDSNQDVVTATQHVLERFLSEIKSIAKIKQDILERRKERLEEKADGSSLNQSTGTANRSTNGHVDSNEGGDTTAADSSRSDGSDDEDLTDDDFDAEYVPGQDVPVEHPKILGILVEVLGEAEEEHIQLAALRWIDSFFDICPTDILACTPDVLSQVLPALSSKVDQVRHAGDKVNDSLMSLVASLPDDDIDGGDMAAGSQHVVGGSRDSVLIDAAPGPEHALDYDACVNALTMQFLDEHEATRVASLSWLIMLQRKAPKRVLAAHDGTFPALLKTLSDPSDAVVTRDLQLLSQISQRSDDVFFTNFMVNLLKLFCTDKHLLQTRGNLVIRQLCTSLSPERIYRVMADCLEKDEDAEFAATMVQNLNNNLMTAPELADLRRKLRHVDFRVGQSPQDGNSLFVVLFRAWCHNAVATLSLCLLAQAYEQAYSILQTFADLEMPVNLLIQIDKLIQLLESPVFTCKCFFVRELISDLRLHLLEPTLYPHLYKTLYGILMLLPQSAAFASLKNRLNAVSAIGYLSMPAPAARAVPAASSNAPAAITGTGGGATGSAPSGGAGARLKGAGARDEPAATKWPELLERFKFTQEQSRRKELGSFAQGVLGGPDDWSQQSASRVATGLQQNRGRSSRPTSSGPGLLFDATGGHHARFGTPLAPTMPSSGLALRDGGFAAGGNVGTQVGVSSSMPAGGPAGRGNGNGSASHAAHGSGGSTVGGAPPGGTGTANASSSHGKPSRFGAAGRLVSRASGRDRDKEKDKDKPKR